MSNLLIEATAGSGKTTTLVNSLIYMKTKYPDQVLATDEQKDIYNWCVANLPPEGKVGYFSFSKQIQMTLEKRILKGAKAYTFHGYGQSVLTRRHGYQKLDNKRGANLVSEITGRPLIKSPDRAKWYSVLKYIEKLKLEYRYPTEENMLYVREKYADLAEIPLTNGMTEMAIKLMELMRIPNGCIEFIDMAWLGAQYIDRPEFDIGFVDECQDLSVLFYTIVKKACKNLVFCGDPNQAIMQFAGAHAHMFDDLRKDIPNQKPLKITFRCPPNICKLANQIRPTAKMRTNKTTAGPELRMARPQLVTELTTGRLPAFGTGIICRTNAPLFSTAFILLKNKVPTHMVGTDILNRLEWMAKSIKVNTIQEFLAKLDSYEDKLEDVSETARIILQDQADCLRLVASECSHVSEIIPAIKELFETTNTASVHLSSVHRAKGLEWPTVAILNPPIPHPRGLEDPIQREQEYNLDFVGVTRTKNTLIWTPEE